MTLEVPSLSVSMDFPRNLGIPNELILHYFWLTVCFICFSLYFILLVLYFSEFGSWGGQIIIIIIIIQSKTVMLGILSSLFHILLLCKRGAVNGDLPSLADVHLLH